MNDNNNTVYIVSGLPRSGTSMMIQILEAGGLQIVTDNIRTSDDDNLQGYYEFERVKQLRDGDVEWVEQANGKVVKVISALLEYLPEDYRYKIIFMEREMAEILSSQKKMLERRGKSGKPDEDEKFADLYKKHLDKVKNWLSQQPNMDVLYVKYNDLMKHPQTHTVKVAEFLQVSLNVQAMADVPQERFYRQRSSAVQI